MQIQKKVLTVDDLTDEIVAAAIDYGLVNAKSVIPNAAIYDTSVNQEIAKQINVGLEGAQDVLGLF